MLSLVLLGDVKVKLDPKLVHVRLLNQIHFVKFLLPFSAGYDLLILLFVNIVIHIVHILI